MATKNETKKNNFHVRVYDEEILTSIYELVGTGSFESMNDLLNRALGKGIEEIYKIYGKRKSLGTVPMPENNVSEELLKRFKHTEMTLDDVFVLMSVLEMLVTSLYNVQRALIAGEAISAELLDSGYFAELPRNLKEIKDELISRKAKKNTKKD